MTITPEGSRFLMGHDSDFGKIPNRLHRKADMKSDSLKATDAFSAARSTGPRVTLEGMEDKIVAKHFFVAGDALHKLGHPVKQLGPFDLLTICLLEMANGFTVIGKSAPAAPENFDREKGQVLAYEDAIRQLWPLMGFALRQKLHGGV